MLDRGGARRPLIIGCALAAVGFALWGWKVTDLSLGAQWPYIVMAGAGLIGMALALVLAFVVALAHPGGQPAAADQVPEQTPEPAA
jgi:hypothetical protein